MTILVGKEYCKVDPAGRFKFPAALKKLLKEVVEDGFVIRESIFDRCLELYPRKEFEKEIEEKISRLNPYNKTDRILIRKLSEGNSIELDTNDRLLIPSDQKKAVGINREIVLISKINLIEIWDVEAYDAMNRQEIDFAEMAAARLGQVGEEKVSE